MNHDELKVFARDILIKSGIMAAQAEAVSDSLIHAELWGYPSHGLIRLSHYLKRIGLGSINKGPEIKVIQEEGHSLLIDGDNGLGHLVGTFAMKEIIRRGEKGIFFAAVRRSNHFGTAGYFSRMALDKDMIGIAMTHTDASVLPSGGKKPVVGTNAISIAVPTKGDFPVVLDMATSQSSLGKIMMAAREGRTVPDNWGVDEDGRPTTDPGKIKYLLPLGGHKGYALSFLIDILCGPLTGSLFGRRLPLMYGGENEPQGLGHCFGVIPVSIFRSVSEFKSAVKEMIDDVHATPATGKKVQVPGEPEWIRERELRQKGITLPPETMAELRSLSDEYGVEFA